MRLKFLEQKEPYIVTLLQRRFTLNQWGLKFVL